MNIVIGGSYHKFLNEINALHRRLEENGHHVIAPIKDARQSKIDSRYYYVVSQGEETENPQEDPQYRYFKRFYQMEDSPEDYERFVCMNIYGYENDGALTIGIDSLLTKEKDKDFDNSR